MTRTMEPNERRAVADTAASINRELDRLREHGPWHDPEAELLLTGRSHADKVAHLEHIATGLGALR